MKESQNAEFKQSWHDEYLKWICGFANAKGGRLLIGVDDAGKPVGVANAKKLLEDIPNKIRDTMGIVADVSLVKRKKKDVVQIVVRESDFPVAYRGEYHYRTGSTKQQLTGFALTQFLFHKMHLSWDGAETVNRLSSRKFTFRRLKYRFEQRVHKDVKNADLVSYGLITKDGVLTNAGALLADDCPIPQSRLFCTRWLGNDKAADSAASRKEQGNILELLDMAESFIKVHTNKGWVKRPTERDNYPDYPERAVTESLVNAFIHRDYTICGSEVHVDIFDDRMEIMSPGGMPDGSLVQELDVMNVPSDRRNGILADVFDRLDYMEREGSGFKKIVGAYSTNISRNPSGFMPKFYSAVGCFVVTLPNLNTREVAIEAKNETAIESSKKSSRGRVRAESGQSQGRVRAESGDIKDRIVAALRTGELSKSEIATAIGLGRVSGYLNRVVRALLADGLVEPTLKDKPSSRLQKYRLVGHDK